MTDRRPAPSSVSAETSDDILAKYRRKVPDAAAQVGWLGGALALPAVQAVWENLASFCICHILCDRLGRPIRQIY